MNLLVTGGCGFIGSNFIRYWLKQHPEDSVVVYDKLTYAGRKENLHDLWENPHLELVVGDIGDMERRRQTCQYYMVDLMVNFPAYECSYPYSTINEQAWVMPDTISHN